MAEMHKVKLSPDMVARVTKRRGGKLHAFDRRDPAKTALIVIDMQNVWVKKPHSLSLAAQWATSLPC